MLHNNQRRWYCMDRTDRTDRTEHPEGHYRHHLFRLFHSSVIMLLPTFRFGLNRQYQRWVRVIMAPTAIFGNGLSSNGLPFLLDWSNLLFIAPHILDLYHVFAYRYWRRYQSRPRCQDTTGPYPSDKKCGNGACRIQAQERVGTHDHTQKWQTSCYIFLLVCRNYFRDKIKWKLSWVSIFVHVVASQTT